MQAVIGVSNVDRNLIDETLLWLKEQEKNIEAEMMKCFQALNLHGVEKIIEDLWTPWKFYLDKVSFLSIKPGEGLEGTVLFLFC